MYGFIPYAGFSPIYFTSFGRTSIAFLLQPEESVKKVSESHSILAYEIIHVQLCSEL